VAEFFVLHVTHNCLSQEQVLAVEEEVPGHMPTESEHVTVFLVTAETDEAAVEVEEHVLSNSAAKVRQSAKELE
jgi:hypothetical protein